MSTWAPVPPQSGVAAPATSNPSYNNINTNNGQAPGSLSGSSTAPTYSPGPAYQPTGLQPGQGSPGDVGFNGNVPGMGENVSAAYLNYYGQDGTPTTSNYAGQAYQDFRSSSPANMSPYYDNAERNQTNDINKQMAARGQYGSSNAIGTIANATTNLRAQQAKDEAQYGLSRYSLGGSLAGGADSASGAQSTNELNWMKGVSDLGFANQKEGTARYELGNEDAYKAAATMSGIQGAVGNSEIEADRALLAASLQAGSGVTADQVAAAQTRLSQANATSNQNTATTTGALQTGSSVLANYV